MYIKNMDTEKENLEKMLKSLLEAFESIPDPRGKYGKRHPLPAILALATAGMISGARSLYAIVSGADSSQLK